VTASPPPRTVGVQGVASESIPSEASAATAVSAYHQGLADAVSDGQGKAQLLAEKTGATLGPIQSAGEGGGYIQCPEGQEYEGTQPDFGSSGVAVMGASNAAAVAPRAPALRKPARRHPRRSARKSTAAACTLYAQVSLVYLLS
jgi:hypothetical protein